MSATPRDETGRFQTADWDATLDQLNTAQNIVSDAGEGEPVRDDRSPERDAEPTQTEARTPAPDGPTDEGGVEESVAPQTPDEVAQLRRELAELQRKQASYDGNLRQRDQEYQQRLQQAMQGQGPEIERIKAEAAREGERRAIRQQISELPPQDRGQWEAQYHARWAEEDRQAQVERQMTQAQQTQQHAQSVLQQAQVALVASNIGPMLGAYAPRIAADVRQQLGGDVDDATVKAFITRPEFLEIAKQSVAKGPDAVNLFAETLTGLAGIHIRDQRAAQATAAQAQRAKRDASGVGRDQTGVNGRTPADFNQFKSSKTKAGDWDGALAALNQQQGIQTVRKA